MILREVTGNGDSEMERIKTAEDSLQWPVFVECDKLLHS